MIRHVATSAETTTTGDITAPTGTQVTGVHVDFAAVGSGTLSEPVKEKKGDATTIIIVAAAGGGGFALIVAIALAVWAVKRQNRSGGAQINKGVAAARQMQRQGQSGVELKTNPMSPQGGSMNVNSPASAPGMPVKAPSSVQYAGSDWIQCVDPSNGMNYYANRVTGETSWDPPPGF